MHLLRAGGEHLAHLLHRRLDGDVHHFVESGVPYAEGFFPLGLGQSRYRGQYLSIFTKARARIRSSTFSSKWFISSVERETVIYSYAFLPFHQLRPSLRMSRIFEGVTSQVFLLRCMFATSGGSHYATLGTSRLATSGAFRRLRFATSGVS